ncbi:MAG: RNA polymerase sigma-70 factor [Paludibacter sp.]|nr:RNA polymerase sigma-70 factor [Paludibacter sp.]
MDFEQNLLIELKRGNQEAFTLLFRKYYKDLVLFGGSILKDRVKCEDIVQNIFLKIWSDRNSIEIEKSLKSFLIRSVQNSCLDELRHKQVVRDHESYVQAFNYSDCLDTENYVLYSDLQDKLQIAVDKLPQTYKEAFMMNRFKGLKYKEIAERLQVSERTVEVRISKAISLLRNHLKEYLLILIAFLIS